MLERIHHALYVAERERGGHEASATAAIIDSRTAESAQKGGVAATTLSGESQAPTKSEFDIRGCVSPQPK